MEETYQELLRALGFMERALEILDRIGEAPQATPHLDLAIERVRGALPSGLAPHRG